MNDSLVKVRFELNMARIHGLIRLLFSSEELKAKALFHSEGARADILRAIVVFLHATLEVVLRSHLPKPDKSLSFYSKNDLDKALRLSKIDPQPFSVLYPPLIQMAKRRKRIVHEADLLTRTDMTSAVWGVVDDWELIMWSMAVPAFYFQFRISIGAATEKERIQYQNHRTAMDAHVKVGNQLVGFSEVSPDGRLSALLEIGASFRRMAKILKGES